MPPPHRVTLFIFIFEKNTFEVDASINENTLTETKKIGMIKLNTNNMNNDSNNDATNRPI